MSAVPANVPTRRVLLIGIGPGGADQLTLAAADAIGRVDVFVLIEKRAEAAELVEVRRAMLERHARASHRVVPLEDSQRDEAAPYTSAVDAWHSTRAAALARALLVDVPEDELAGLLVWGDPSLYDSTIRLLDRVNTTGDVHVDYEVVAGVSSVQLLAARHRIVLNRVGGSVLITTGRRLAEHGLPDGVDDVVVMLDGELTFTTLTAEPLDIYWGAYLGLDGELLISGGLADVADRIVEARTTARQRRGWIFDVYLLRRRTAH